MHFQALALLMISISVSIIVAVGARAHHENLDAADTFALSPIYGYTMIVCGLFFCAVPFFPGISGMSSPILVVWYFSPFWLGAFVSAIYLLLYRVTILDQSTFTVGAFRQRVIRCSEIIDWDLIKGTRSSELWVYLRSGKKWKLSSLLSDFDELAAIMNSHTAILPHGHPDSPRKLKDRELRAQNARQASWRQAALTFLQPPYHSKISRK